MSSHLRHCPKHRKPLPCAHCALTQKPALAPTPEIAAEPVRSAAAIRGQKWREKQKQQDPKFNAEEAKRRREERKQKRKEQEVAKFVKKHPEFPLNLNQLRKVDDRSGLFMSGAPRGKGQLIPVGNSEQIEMISGLQTADAVMSELPRRAQLTDEELQKKLADATIDLQQKIDLILEHWKHDEEFCALVNSWSLDEITKFIQQVSENLEYARELLYEHTEHQARAPHDSIRVLTHALPHGRRVVPEGISDDHEGDLPSETDSSFARKIDFKKSLAETLQIGNRNVKFYNVQNGTAEQHFEKFVRANTEPQPNENGDLPDTPMVCNLCQSEIAPGAIGCVIAPRFSVESGFKHFGAEHRQKVIDHIRWWEAKAFRPKSRTKCDRDHEGMASRHGGGTLKVQCKRCKKILYKPPKKAPEPRSDTSKHPHNDMPQAA
jgi:hypothetical protein